MLVRSVHTREEEACVAFVSGQIRFCSYLEMLGMQAKSTIVFTLNCLQCFLMLE